MNKIANWVAWLLPARIVFFAFFRFWAHATTYQEGALCTPEDMNWKLALDLWERKYGPFDGAKPRKVL
jgi:hypothetical protein